MRRSNSRSVVWGVLSVAACSFLAACGGGANTANDSGAVRESGGDAPSDTSTGAVDAEENAPSVEAFLAAESRMVSLEPDFTRAVSGTATPETGVRLTSTDSEGSIYVLDVPSGAVTEPTFIELSPAIGLDGPAVNIEPEGLQLESTALLRITPSKPEPGSEPVWVDLGGMVNRTIAGSEDDTTVVFPLRHFSGYGLAPEGFVGPPLGPIDQLRMDVGDAIDRAIKTGEMSIDPAIGDKIERAWSTYVRPLMERAGKECVGRAAISEFLRLASIDQTLGLDRLDRVISATKQTERLAKIFAKMRVCAREDCAQGKANAIPDLYAAFMFAFLFDVPGAEDQDELFAALSPEIDPVWGKCKYLQVFVSFTLNLSAVWPTPYTLSEVIAGSGIIAPGDDGQSTAFGLMQGADGVADAFSKGGSMIATAILSGNPTPMTGLCSVGDFGRGRMEATMKGAGTKTPTLTLDPYLATAPVTCGDIKASYSPQVFLLYIVAKMNEQLAIEHTFTESERWPSGGQKVLGYNWTEDIEAADTFNTFLGERWLDSSSIKVRVTVRVGSSNGPSIEPPATTGLINVLESLA